MSKFLEKLKGKKWIEYLFLGILSLAVIIIFASGLFSSGKSNKTDTADEAYVYITNMETKLTNALSSVKGVGKVNVTISAESKMETVLAMETVKTTNAQGVTTVTETPILVNGKTVTLIEKYPKITGVLIVAQGADNLAIIGKIQQATVSLLNIEINKIEILSMN